MATQVLLMLVTVTWVTAARAQVGKYKQSEEVQVSFLNEWRPGVVVDTNRRGAVLAEFEFAGTQKRQVFPPNQVRRPYEANALSPGRVWTDASGNFKIPAALVEIDGGQITLRKADTTEISVPLAKLSDSDQRFVARLSKDAGGRTSRPPKPPSLTRFETSRSMSQTMSLGGEKRQQLDPDPAPPFEKVVQGGTGFPMEDFFDRLGAVIPVGGPDAWVLAGLENTQPGNSLPTRLLWVSLSKQEVGGRQMLPGGEVVMDYHAPTHRLLTYIELEGEGLGQSDPALTLWEVLPNDSKVKPVIRWLAATGDQAPNEPWARLAGGDTVIQKVSDHEYVGWDVAGKKIGYRLTQEAFFAPQPTLSPGRKYLFIPEDQQTRILDSRSGRQLATLPAADGASGVAVSEDGRRAAVLNRSVLRVWDLTNLSTPPIEYQAEAIGTPFQARIRWVDDEHVMADTGGSGLVLFSLKHKLALWNYQFDHNAIREAGGRRVRDIVDGHLVYGASVQSGTDRGLAVGAVELPGPQVAEVEASLDPDRLMILKPGSAVSLAVRAGENQSRVQAALEREIRENGWVIRPTANAVITAEMKRGQTQQVTYRFVNQADQSASVTPYISTLKIEVGGEVAWQSGTRSGAPPVITLEQGANVQAEVDRWQKPNVGFFEQVDIPDRILDPEKSRGLGTTRVTNRGLVVTDGP